MSKNTLDDVIFDAILSSAFKDAAIKEFSSVGNGDVEPVKLTAKHKRIERKLYDQLYNKKYTPTWVKVLQRTAACILVCFLAASILVFSIPTIRAEFFKLIAKTFDQYTSFEVSAENLPSDGEYSFNYLPENFELVYFEKDVWRTYKYENPVDQSSFEIFYYPGTNATLHEDNDRHIITKLVIDDNDAWLLSDKSTNSTKLLWSDGENIFDISGAISSDEMIKIASNIVKN